MIADLKPYAEYKESGLPWLGQVPGHWEVVRSKRLFAQRKELAFSDDQQLSATQAFGVIPQALYEERTGYRVVKISMHLDKRRHVEAGDFVISMRSFQGGLERAWSSGAIRSSYVVLKPHQQNHAGYFQFLFKSMPYISALRATADFIRDGQDLNFDNFCGVSLPLIPRLEQEAIGRFLDWANRQLERAIRAKRKVIALLNEQKHAIIHRAVTRGLDPSVPLKPSGIPWLGDIPQNWGTPLFGRLLTKVEQGWSPVAAEGELALDQWAVLTLSAVRRGVFNPAAIKPVSLTASIPTGIDVREGDVLLTRSNTRDRVGDVCVVRAPRPKTILCDLIYRLRVRADAIAPDFLVYQLLSRVGRGQIERDARGSSPNFSPKKSPTPLWSC